MIWYDEQDKETENLVDSFRSFCRERAFYIKSAGNRHIDIPIESVNDVMYDMDG
jgi:hypothetical protein